MIPIAAGFKSTAVKTIASIINPTPGTPAVPILATTAITITVNICTIDNWAPDI